MTHPQGASLKQQVLFIHGGGDGAHEADAKLASSLRDALGSEYDVQCPKMPNEDRPEYDAWKHRIMQELSALGDRVVLVGHSLGASILLKYLVEEDVNTPVAGLFLIAAPYWGAEDWNVGAFALPEHGALPDGLPVFFYHSRDDDVVPFSHLALYRTRFPEASHRKFDGRGHQFDNDLSGIARDIQTL
jgi:predicted alpha/beta hydrolase family esterase